MSGLACSSPSTPLMKVEYSMLVRRSIAAAWSQHIPRSLGQRHHPDHIQLMDSVMDRLVAR